MRRLAILALAIVLLVSAAPKPALACSCAWPPDISRWLDDSPGGFVGTLVKKEGGLLGAMGQEATFVFQVDQWAKGGPGETVEISAPVDSGGNCGLRLDVGDQVGMILHWSGGRLSSSSCSTFEPALLLDAKARVPDSETMVPWLLVSVGNVFEVLDEEGKLVTRLDSRRSHEESGQTFPTHVSVCPGGERFVHVTEKTLGVWDVGSLTLLDQIENDDLGGSTAVSCRDPQASEVFVAIQGGAGSSLVEAVSGEMLLAVSGTVTGIGATHLTTEDGVGVGRVDLSTGETEDLIELSLPFGNGYATATPNPFNETTALIETEFDESPTSTLRIFDGKGDATVEIDYHSEAYPVGWFDEWTYVALEGPGNDLHFIDVRDGSIVTLPNQPASAVMPAGDEALVVAGDELLSFDPSSGNIERVAFAPSTAAPVMLLSGAASVDEPRTVHTVPPFVPEATGEEVPAPASVARLALYSLLALAAGAAAFIVFRRRSAEQE